MVLPGCLCGVGVGWLVPGVVWGGVLPGVVAPGVVGCLVWGWLMSGGVGWVVCRGVACPYVPRSGVGWGVNGCSLALRLGIVGLVAGEGMVWCHGVVTWG